MTATATPDAATTTLSDASMQKLEALAAKNGWTLDQTVDRAAGLLEYILEWTPKNAEPKAYVYKDGERYSIRIPR